MNVETLKMLLDKPKHRVFLNDYCTEVVEVVDNEELSQEINDDQVELALLTHESDNDSIVVDIADLDSLLIVVKELDNRMLCSKGK